MVLYYKLYKTVTYYLIQIQMFIKLLVNKSVIFLKNKVIKY